MSGDPITSDLAPLMAAAAPLLAPARAVGHRVRSVHSHGSQARSVLVEVDVRETGARDRTLLLVAHVSNGRIPPMPVTVSHHGENVHLWRFPHDPYLPGLAGAVNRRTAGHLLAELNLGDGSIAALRTRAYRPTRRAVVEIRPSPSEPPALYRKVLGGRSPRRVRRRAAALAETHEALGAVLPVPPVLERDDDLGVVTLGRLTGDTLRSRLRGGLDMPPASDIADLVRTFSSVEGFDGDGDPGRYADVTRHVRTLSRLLPDRAADLDEVARLVTDIGGPTGLLHGDLHDGQLLVERGHVTGILDVDGVGRGPVALDIGRLLANIEVAADHGPLGASVAPQFALDVEAALSELAPEADIAKAAACAWIGLATGPHRVQSDDWEVRTNLRIDHAISWAERTV